LIVAQVFGDLQEFLEYERSAGDSFQYTQLPVLDALRNSYLAIRRQQRNTAHFAEIYPNRIVGSSQCSGR
jgi:hypothetical protein